MKLTSFQGKKHYQAYQNAKNFGVLPSGTTLRGGLSDQQLMKKTAPDYLNSGAGGEAGADELDKTGQLNKLRSETPHNALNLSDKAAKKGCSCQDCRADRAKKREDIPTVDEQDKLQRKAVAKMVSHKLAAQLVKLPDTDLRKAYQRTLNCANYHYVEGGEIHTEYCRCRWCLVCNRIRTAQLIDTYVPVISAWNKPQMLTLTIPNCSGFELENTIQRMQDVFVKITRLIRRGRKRKTYVKDSKGNYKHDDHGNRIIKDQVFKGQKFEALRKIECTYNEKTGEYHPHLHVAINSGKVAHLIRMEWLKSFKNAEYQAQDITPIDKSDLGSVKELFKYFSKIFSTVKKNDGKEVQVAHVERLNVIFEAMHGKRTLQPYGFTKKDYQQEIERINIADNVKNELSETEIDEIIDFESELKRSEINVPDGVYRWVDNGWKNTRTSHRLVDFEPFESLQRLVDNILIYGYRSGELCNVPGYHLYSQKEALKLKRTYFKNADGIGMPKKEKCHQTTPQTQIKSWIQF